jgi:hypothetical protein
VRTLPDPGFAGDDGTAAPGLAEALAAYERAPESAHHATLAVLQDARLLVPVVAMLGEVEYDDRGLAHDKTSDMAAVLMRGRDGRLALLSFTGTAALSRWDARARPVPVTARQAARAARHDQAEALLVDVAGPVMFVVQGEDLRALAEGHRLVRVGSRWAWTRREGRVPGAGASAARGLNDEGEAPGR